MKTRRIWIFRLICVLAVPAALLLSLEFALRAIEYGSPSSFFIPSVIDGEEVWVPNERFSEIYFAERAEIAIPDSTRISRMKGDGVCRIVVLGGSAAFGDPDVNVGISRFLEHFLSERYPDVQFEVINAAMVAVNSHAVRHIAEDSLKLDPDMFLIYMGNNEVIGPYGPESSFTADFTDAYSILRVRIKLRTTRTAQLITDLFARISQRTLNESTTEEDLLLQKKPLRFGDPKLEQAYRNFSMNLERIVSLAEENGTPCVVSSVAANLRDWPPIYSVSSPPDSASAIRWRAAYDRGRVAEEAGLFLKASEAYHEAFLIDAEHADLLYGMGVSHFELGELEKAETYLSLALDHDAVRIRGADTRINQCIHESLLETDRTVAVKADVKEGLYQRSGGSPGNEWFLDHVHFSVEGNYQVSRILLPAVESLLPEWVKAKKHDAVQFPDLDACKARFGYSAWSAHVAASTMYDRQKGPPYYLRQRHERLILDRWRERLLLKELAEQKRDETESVLTVALRGSPEDWRLKEMLARFYLEGERVEEALPLLHEVVRRLPQRAAARELLANTLAGENRLSDAIRILEKGGFSDGAIARKLSGWGMQAASSGDLEVARMHAARGLDLSRQSSAVQNLLGVISIIEGDSVSARNWFGKALKADAANWKAKSNMGNMELARGRPLEAIEHYQRSLRYSPYDSQLRLNLGMAYELTGRRIDAERIYRRTLRMEPESKVTAMRLIELLRKTSGIDDARKVLMSALDFHPADSELLEMKAAL